ncbi:MAG TPA: hypothetical protein VFZ90_06570 [Gemmatimonadales bacterium]
MPVLAPSRQTVASLLVAMGLVALLASWAPEGPRTYTGSTAVIGKGQIQSYVVLTPSGVPAAVGVNLTEGALEQLPVHKNRRSRCFDLNGDATIAASECVGDEERILQLPDDIVARAQLPFRWISVNWNAEGHHPPPPKPGEAPAPPIYARPHFDFHFFAWDRERIEAIAPGPCGEFVDCGDFERGRKPIPPRFVPEGHVDLGIVVPRMGNHLLDSRSPELVDPATPFTRTFIYGAFDGELIFWEPMITFDFLGRTSDACFEIRQPAA